MEKSYVSPFDRAARNLGHIGLSVTLALVAGVTAVSTYEALTKQGQVIPAQGGVVMTLDAPVSFAMKPRI